jgi:DNA-binding response OmpR family regulator
MTKRKILIIDDDLFWHRLLARIFISDAYEVHTAASCEDGVRMAEKHKPDCILLDFHLRDGDAVSVCSALKNGGSRPKFPVIVVSSDPDAEITAYSECHAAYFVLKGSRTMLELPSIVMKVLGNMEGDVSWEPSR